VSITATGAGKDSDITVRGSNIEAGKATSLKADDQVNIVAAQNTTQESSNSKNSSGSIGVGFQLGAGGAQAGVTVSASAGKGQGAGNSTTYTNSQVAGNTVNIESGGDTTIKGGVVKADQVTANVGGNLNIESLQDKSQYNEKSQQVGGSVTFGPAAGGSVNVGQTKINSDYLSVGEQSAIRAGDGGFNVNVQGKTNLTGGQITSTQAAIDNNKNSYEAKEGTTTTDLNNSAKYSANSVSVGVGAGSPAPGQSMSATMSGVGLGNDKGSAQSTTTAGISGVAGNTSARTGDKSTSIAPIFDKDKTQKEVAAQVAITSEFGKQASKAVGDYAQKQYDKALAEKDQAGIDAWKEGGSSRVTLHAVVGGLTGGAAGAVGSGAASAAAPALDDLQGQLQQGLQKAGLGDDASKLIASLASGATAAGIGAAASGGSVAGGATAFNADMNNRQIGAQERNLAKNLSDKAKASSLTKADGTAYTQADIENAMRNSGKGSESITQGMLVDPKGITDKGAVFTAGSDGKTLVQVNSDGSPLNPNTIDLQLAAYIVQQTGGVNTPYRDLYNRVEAAKAGQPSNPNAGLNTVTPNANGALTAEAAAGLFPVRNPVRDVNDIRNDVADGAAVVGRGSDVTAATSTMAAAVPGPHQPGAATTALIATGVGFAANVVEQVARPNAASSAENAFYMAIQMGADSALPIAAPITNEVINAWKNSKTNLEFKEWAAIEWRKFIETRSKP
jgi:Hemagglutinin repeat